MIKFKCDLNCYNQCEVVMKDEEDGDDFTPDACPYKEGAVAPKWKKVEDNTEEVADDTLSTINERLEKLESIVALKYEDSFTTPEIGDLVIGYDNESVYAIGMYEKYNAKNSSCTYRVNDWWFVHILKIDKTQTLEEILNMIKGE